jgi:DNA-binding LacI/PurR family transcriptional regulator
MNKVADIIISQESVVSLHVQLHNQLRQHILSGYWPINSRIPSENQFAEHLGLSRGTIRLALQQAEVEGLIERIAGRGTFVAYTPAKDRKDRLIAFVTCDFDSENQLLVLTGIEGEAKARGYQVVFNKAKNRQEEIELLRGFQEKKAGVALWPNGSDTPHQNARVYQQLRIPIVLLDRKIHGFDCDCVTSDNYGGARALMQHLIELGHRDIVALSHHGMDLSSVRDRYCAYQDVMEASGLKSQKAWLIGQPGKEMSFHRAIRSSVDNKSPELQQIKEHMINAKPYPTAIFAVNDLLAVLAMRTMKLLGIAVPHVVSVAGFDDTDLAAHLEVPLTTVAQDPFSIGKKAAQMLIDRLEGFVGPVNHHIIPTQLRVRSSTALPAKP